MKVLSLNRQHYGVLLRIFSPLSRSLFGTLNNVHIYLTQKNDWVPKMSIDMYVCCFANSMLVLIDDIHDDAQQATHAVSLA